MTSDPAPRPGAIAGAIAPMLAYDDAPAAIDFLVRAFGFEERFRLPMPDGRLGHAELTRGDAVVMLASAYPEMGLVSPAGLPAVHCQLRLRVEDVDAHFARAKAEGATIAAEPCDEPHGDRDYRAVDPEGHRWIFYTPLRTMTPDEVVAAWAEE